ncbi:hypothetical protein [Neisseria sp. Marseille-Q2251]|uniref:hypothetical protein n=1 Tax=Neisseria sp. Marseille-Q2251 TaxID=2866585 RepID=UPI0031394A31
MQSNFKNRIDTQRNILDIVNSYSWNEELYGLSNLAIKRWENNNPNIDNNIINTLIEISDNLFFLGAKSQEQITEDYRNLSTKISYLEEQLINLLNSNLE